MYNAFLRVRTRIFGDSVETEPAFLRRDILCMVLQRRDRCVLMAYFCRHNASKVGTVCVSSHFGYGFQCPRYCVLCISTHLDYSLQSPSCCCRQVWSASRWPEEQETDRGKPYIDVLEKHDAVNSNRLAFRRSSAFLDVEKYGVASKTYIV